MTTVIKTHTPLRVGRPAGNRFEEGDPVKAEVKEVDQTDTEGSEEVKSLTDKVATCRRQIKSGFICYVCR